VQGSDSSFGIAVATFDFMSKAIVGALCVVFLLSGCGDDADPSSAPDIPITVLDLSGDLKTTCEVPASCKACAVGTICADSSGVFNRHVPTCLKTCNTTSDCLSGELCAVLYAESIAPQGVCVSPTNPPPCGTIESTYHCDFPPASCLDANTLSKPFSQASNGICGHEKIHCASGCVNDSPDGGVPTGHCN
jgi:hypothetical protein